MLSEAGHPALRVQEDNREAEARQKAGLLDERGRLYLPAWNH